MISSSKKIGLCLSGGGLRAIAHLGLIKALQDYKITPDLVSGTSAGAIIGALYAYGYDVDSMLKMVTENAFFSSKNIQIKQDGIFNPKMLSQIFEKYIPENDFQQLKIPLYVAATNINSGEAIIFSKGALTPVLLASASIPYVFPSTIIDEAYYCDGGLLNNLPIEPLKAQQAFIIASHVNAVAHMSPKEVKKLSPKSMIERLLNLGMANHVNEKAKACDIFVEPSNLSQYSMFDKKNTDVLFWMGYEAACKSFEKYGLQKN